ncbi:MAG: SDR family NAD(P)-dependent oxidoreductase [Muribaculaceae bacterium]
MAKNSSIYIVTGATGAIGKAIAMQLAIEGKPVMLACRNLDAALSLRQQIISNTANDNILVEQLSLDSFASIRAFATRLISTHTTVKALINNAGIMCRNFSLTVDGYEETLAVNYFGTLLLSNLLIPIIEKGGDIVFTTSVTRKVHNLPEDIIEDSKHNFSQLGTYASSKLALTHHALHLATILKDAEISVNCADPGVVNSNMITMHRWFDPLSNIFFRPFISSPRKGARAALRALKVQNVTAQIFTPTSSEPIPTEWLQSPAHSRLIKNAEDVISHT